MPGMEKSRIYSSPCGQEPGWGIAAPGPRVFPPRQPVMMGFGPISQHYFPTPGPYPAQELLPEPRGVARRERKSEPLGETKRNAKKEKKTTLTMF